MMITYLLHTVIWLLHVQEAVRKQLDAFAEQLTVDESLTPVSTCMQLVVQSLCEYFFMLHVYTGATSQQTKEWETEDRHGETERSICAEGGCGLISRRFSF